MESWAILLAACAAAGFALSTSLQHHSAGRTPATVATTRGLLMHLAGRPWWVVGQVVAAVSFVLHALALRWGTISVVQPVVVSGIVLAVPTRAALNRRLPSVDELGTVGLTAAGLAVLLVASRPTPGHGTPDQLVAAAAATAGMIAALALTAYGATRPDPHRAAAWLGVAAGILFGEVAGLVKLAFAQVNQSTATGPAVVLGIWALWAVPVVGLCGVAINQRAYRVARLSASMPVLNIVDMVIALGFGVAVFGEVPRHTPVAVAAETAALACIAIGLRRLSRGDAVEPLVSATQPATPPAESPAESTAESTRAHHPEPLGPRSRP